MQNKEDKLPQNVPASIAEIIKRNPVLWNKDGRNISGTGDQLDKPERILDSDYQKQLTQSPIIGDPKTEVSTQEESINPTTEDDEDDYFITKPINSSFEINLAEFPIAYLNRGQLPEGYSKTEYQYKDIIRGRDGKPVERTWSIEAHATEEIQNEIGERKKVNLGFGGPATLEVIYELFQLWKEQGFKEPKIHVGSFYNLLKRLDWGTGNSQYKQLRRVLNCLHGLHIKGEQCFYVPEIDHYENVDFYPFPRINTYTKEEKKISPDDYVYVSVDQEFFKAVKSKTVYYIPFDRFYFKKLKPMEQKVALMLSKIFSPYRKKPRFEWRRNIFEFSNQIPILTKEANQTRRQLKRICDGLLSKNFPFLSSYKLEGETIVFYNNMQTSLNLIPTAKEQDKKDYDTVEYLINEQLKICGDQHSKAFYTLVAKYVPIDMIFRALSEARQEGKVKSKLYTKIILERGKKYLDPYLKKARQKEDSIELPEDEKKQIEIELIKEKEKFEIRKTVSSVKNGYLKMKKKMKICNSLLTGKGIAFLQSI